MGLHHESNHGRVFRGLDATKHLEMQKRDSHGNKVKMNIPSKVKAAARVADPAQTQAKYHWDNKVEDVSTPKAAARPADAAQTQAKYHWDDKVEAVSTTQAKYHWDNKAEDVQTVQSVVYVTLSADFTGETAGYTTLTSVQTTSTDIAQSAAQTTTAATLNADEASYVSNKSAAAATSASLNSDEASYVSNKSAAAAGGATTTSPASTSSDDGHNNKSVFLNAPTTAASATSSAVAATVLVGSGVQTTRGATAIVGSSVQATRQAQTSDSNNGMSGGAKAGMAIGILLAFALAGGLLFFCWRRRRNPSAHQEIIDEKRTSSIFGGKTMAEKRASAAPSVRSSATTAPRLSLRPVTQFLPTLANNRKSSGTDDAVAAMSEKPKSMWERRANATENPFEDAAVMSEKQAHPENPFDEPEVNAEKSAHSRNHSSKSSWEGSEPATPKSTKFGTASAVPVSAAGTASAVPPVPQGPNNVHRVQLDFKPSMEDELELKSGQLVRMLHEYDDGWALCVRMDRSQQGVTPRTCLSKLPVKPRPQGPPSNGSNSRPMTPTGPPGMYPRPLTPNGRERSGSDAEVERPTTPTGTVPARKPVPGQAM